MGMVNEYIRLIPCNSAKRRFGIKKGLNINSFIGFIIHVNNTIGIAGGASAAACIGMGEVVGYGASISDQDGFVAMIVGLLSGSLTSTPAFCNS